MKLLKPLLFASLFFIFNSFTTEPKTPINEKVAFNADYLLNSEEFIAFENLLSSSTFKTEDDIVNFETTNNDLIALMSKTLFEETNFLDLNDNQIEQIIENYYLNNAPQKVENICTTMARIMYQLDLIQCGNGPQSASCRAYAHIRFVHRMIACAPLY